MRQIQKRLVTYKRADGVDLTGTLYLPAGYEPARDGRLPLLMWAAAAGIGRRTALTLAGNGWTVGAFDLDEDRDTRHSARGLRRRIELWFLQ